MGWGKAADTYAFGIIAWQLLTGKLDGQGLGKTCRIYTFADRSMNDVSLLTERVGSGGGGGGVVWGWGGGWRMPKNLLKVG